MPTATEKSLAGCRLELAEARRVIAAYQKTNQDLERENAELRDERELAIRAAGIELGMRMEAERKLAEALKISTEETA
jgi:cell division protein FtsB